MVELAAVFRCGGAMLDQYTNPIRYAKRIVGDSAGLILLICSHVAFGAVVWVQLPWRVAPLATLVGVLFPINYLLALRKILVELAKVTGDNEVRPW